MQRLFAIVLLAAFVGGPSLKWWCQQACDPDRPVSATDHCRQSGSAGPKVSAARECNEPSSFVALAAKRISADSLIVPAAPIELPAALGALRMPGKTTLREAADSSPPPHVPLPLRI